MGNRLNLDEAMAKPSSNETLDSLIPTYGEKNETAKQLKKDLSDLGTKIKDILKDSEDGKYTVGGYKANYYIKTSESFEEEKFLHVLHNTPSLMKEAESLELIKTKEYIDMDRLESVLYHNQVSVDFTSELERYTSVKEIPTLTVTKIKEKK